MGSPSLSDGNELYEWGKRGGGRNASTPLSTEAPIPYTASQPELLYPEGNPFRNSVISSPNSCWGDFCLLNCFTAPAAGGEAGIGEKQQQDSKW